MKHEAQSSIKLQSSRNSHLKRNITTELVSLNDFIQSYDAETIGWLLRLESELKALTAFTGTNEFNTRIKETRILAVKLRKFIELKLKGLE